MGVKPCPVIFVEYASGLLPVNGVDQTAPDFVYGDTVGREANANSFAIMATAALDIRYPHSLRGGCDDGIRGGYEHDRARAFRKVALGREHLLADGLGEEEGPARIRGEVQDRSFGGDKSSRSPRDFADTPALLTRHSR